MNVKSQDKNLAEIQAQWVTVRGRIRQKIGDAQFKSWIKVLVFEDYDDQKVILSVSSNFIRTRIIEQYLDIIKSYWLVENLKINDIQIIVSKKNSEKDSKKKPYDKEVWSRILFEVPVFLAYFSHLRGR